MPKKHQGITKDEKRNTWMIHTMITLPNGIKTTITRRGFVSEKEAFAALEEIKKEKLKQYESTERYISWRDACDDYWKYYSCKVKYTTARNGFLSYMVHVIEPYANKSLEEVVRPDNLRAFKNKILDAKYSSNHTNVIIQHMRRTITYQYDRGNVTSSEFKLANIELESVSKKNEIKKERPIWTIEQFRTFIETFRDDDKYKVLFEVFGHLGCRISELRGLQLKHFNTAKREIYIMQQATSKLHTGTFEIVSPKTKKSVRKITVSERINNLLFAFVQDMQYQEDDFLFFGKTPVGESCIRRKMMNHIQKAGVPFIPIHSLRHSNVTWLLNNPKLTIAEISKISERLGHDSKKVTLDIYYHLAKTEGDDNILDVLL